MATIDLGLVKGARDGGNADKLGGKEAQYYSRPYNLLDNSDFRNPVNQRGQASYAVSTQYTIDRWIGGGTTLNISIGEGCVRLENTDAANRRAFYQRFPKNHIGETLTIALCDADSGAIYCASGTIPPPAGANQNPASVYFNNHVVKLEMNTQGTLTAVIMVGSGSSINVRWMAVYEGVYTTDTLPPYVPKGYAAEMAECQRYAIPLYNNARYRASRILTNSSGKDYLYFEIPIPTKMVKTPSLSNLNNSIGVGRIDQGSADKGYEISVSAMSTVSITLRAAKETSGATDGWIVFEGATAADGALLTADL